MRKYGIFVADDEPLILRTIKRNIESSHDRFVVIGEALNGEDAFELIQATKPDVVFTDVRMPVLDGLGLLEKLQSLPNPPISVVVSGYEDFQYVKQALRLGVADYLLKPVQRQELAQVLTNVHHELHAAQNAEQQRMLADWIAGGSSRVPSAAEVAEIFGESPTFTCYLLCAGSAGRFRSSWLTPSAEFWLRHDPGVLLERIEKVRSWTLPLSGRSEMLLIAATDTAGLGQALYEQLNCEEMPVSVAIGKSGVGFHDLVHEAQRLRILLDQSACFGRPVLIGRESIPRASLSTNTLLDSHTEKLLSVFIESDQCVAFKNEFAKLLDRCEEHGVLQIRLERLLKQILHLFAASGKSAPPKRLIEMELEIDELISNSVRYSSIRFGMSLLIDECFQAGHAAEAEDTNSLVSRIDAYLLTHYAQPISLQSIAKQFGITPPYLTAIFKKAKDLPPIEYIAQMRIEKAKELLRLSPPLTLKEIGNAVGYEDPYYLSRVFKSLTGMSPSEYRNRFGGGKEG